MGDLKPLKASKLFFIMFAIIMFMIWIMTSVSMASRREDRRIKLQDIVRGNADNKSIFEVPIVGVDSQNIARIDYNFEEGKTTTECSAKCKGGDTIVRFRYNYPDFRTGEHKSALKTCFCDKDIETSEIKYASNESQLDSYARDGKSKEFISNIAAKFGFKLPTS